MSVFWPAFKFGLAFIGSIFLAVSSLFALIALGVWLGSFTGYIGSLVGGIIGAAIGLSACIGAMAVASEWWDYS